ncbi:hypothetical protein NM208_g13768 [Fusarium decemcellulare]|uniref:Uncharacterized protein n=1 Tax=Fusarium decemcellulare TaxID=57161 RepID=A0ACC1RM18_9HYPO|nr:hypothetical protein NM208_g13768 [Fusarium decemcellulare]
MCLSFPVLMVVSSTSRTASRAVASLSRLGSMPLGLVLYMRFNQLLPLMNLPCVTTLPPAPPVVAGGFHSRPRTQELAYPPCFHPPVGLTTASHWSPSRSLINVQDHTFWCEENNLWDLILPGAKEVTDLSNQSSPY